MLDCPDQFSQLTYRRTVDLFVLTLFYSQRIKRRGEGVSVRSALLMFLITLSGNDHSRHGCLLCWGEAGDQPAVLQQQFSIVSSTTA